MLLKAEDSQLLLIDLQSRLMPAIDGAERVIANARLLLESALNLAVPILASEQYPKGLGPTVPEIAERLPNASERIEKLDFSAWREPAFRAAVEARGVEGGGRSTLVVAGAEAHVCVLQTTLELKAAWQGRVVLVADACGSRRAENKSLAVERLAAAGVEIVSTEMVVFEWLGSAAHPSFKTLSKLLK